MKAIIRTFYPDNKLQEELDNLGMGNDVVIEEYSKLNILLDAGLNIQDIQVMQSDNLLRGGIQIFDTIVYVVKKGERFVQR